ncbi:MAG TPA: hypothetical protein VMF91_02065, partial [Bryobacteraceae bacterium]|nr:hypothetical protein [Bryobacteraceae bacterium]
SGATRHRQRSWLISSDIAEREEVRKRRPLNDAREISADDKWANVARNFVHQPVKDTAISLLERAEGIRRGTVRLFHAGLMPAEQRTARGEAPSRVNDIGEDRRIGRLPELRRAVELARELPGMIARRAQELRHGLRHGLDRGPRLER